MILSVRKLAIAAGQHEHTACQREREIVLIFLFFNFQGDFTKFKRTKDELSVCGDGKSDIISMSLPYDLPLVPYKSEGKFHSFFHESL